MQKSVLRYARATLSRPHPASARVCWAKWWPTAVAGSDWTMRTWRPRSSACRGAAAPRITRCGWPACVNLARRIHGCTTRHCWCAATGFIERWCISTTRPRARLPRAMRSPSAHPTATSRCRCRWPPRMVAQRLTPIGCFDTGL